jgi:DNA-binding winged helix-turn-helix (wHTH) protein
LARGLRAARLVPIPAFDENDLRFCLMHNRFVLLVIESELAKRMAGFLRSGTESSTMPSPLPPILLVGDVGTTEGALEPDHMLRADASVEEIAACAAALVRISRPVRLPTPLRWGPLELDVQRRDAKWHSRPVKLTSSQFRIMEILILAAGSVVSADDLSRHLLGGTSFADHQSIAAHVRRVRDILGPTGRDFLLTVRGEGFRLSDPDEEESTD